MPLALAEPLAVFAAIEAYIWWLRYVAGWLWMPILAFVLLSHGVHRETPRSLGFRADNFGDAVRRFAAFIALLALAMLGCGLIFRTIRPMPLDRAFWSLAIYIPWGVFQQYLLNGYFLNRLDKAFPRRAAPFAAAGLFAAAHTPNWFLILVTFAMGYCAAQIYRRDRNLYFLGLAHGIIGFLLYFVVPDSISHHLNVGPGWFRCG